MEILNLAENALARKLCDHCLGRLFGKLGHGFTNNQRGHALRTVLAMTQSAIHNSGGSSDQPFDDNPAPEECWVCEGLFEERDIFARLLKTAISTIECQTFLIGSRIDPEVVNREETLWAELNITTGEPIKSELNREVGKLIEKDLRIPVDFQNPDVVAIIDTLFNSVTVQITPLFIYGRYRKLVRGIPQTRWPCRRCRGKGCTRCGGTGKMYPESVEELIGESIVSEAEGTNYTLHGMGREDIDARMLGNGRPFIMEITAPKHRMLDLPSLQQHVNDASVGKIEIEGLRYSSRSEVVTIKTDTSSKTYHAHIEFDVPIEDEKLKKAVHTFAMATIRQQTPKRVAHRRADRCRERKVLDFKIIRLDGTEADVQVTGESGLYIKELLHGDDGRTIPNLAETLGRNVTVKELDVIKVHDRDQTLDQDQDE